MRQAVGRAAQNSAHSVPIPAPVGGWNARDSLMKMPEQDAVFLDNFWPTAGNVELRKGFETFATLPADTAPTLHDVKALLSYNTPAAVSTLFACDNTGIYNVTAGGSISTISSVITNGQVRSVNQATSGGNFLWCCNGVDKSRYWAGSAWTVLDGASTPALTGITSTDVINVSQFKTRLMLTQKNSLSFWYLPVVSVAGLAVEFPLGSLFKRGGYLMATTSWTVDGGAGSDDFFVAITSEGEVAVYAGTDPSNAATWALVGTYFIGKPLSRTCFLKYGGDVIVLTVQGPVLLSKALQSSVIDRTSNLSDKIQKVYTSYVENGQSIFGWQAVLFPEAQMLLVNIPVMDDATYNIITSYQFVMNTVTRAWARFTNMSAQAWVYHAGGLYFAAHNKVYQAWTGTDDNGGVITGKAKTAYNYLRSRGLTKHVKLLRPNFTASASIDTQIGLDADFSSKALYSNTSNISQTVALWDVAKWNEGVWSGGDETVAKWKTVAVSPGRCFSVRLRLSCKGTTMAWNAVDVVAETGQGLL